MRICLIANANSEHTIRLALYLSSQNHEVHLISWRESFDLQKFIQLHQLKNSKLPLFREFNWLLQTKRLVQQINPDVIDGHYISVYGFIAAFTGFHPLVVTAWGSDLLIEPWQNPIFKFTSKYAINRADKVICLFPIFFAKDELQYLKADLSKFETCYLGVDTNIFKHVNNYSDMKIDFGLDLSSEVVINTRGLAPVYDIETFTKAIPIVLNRVPQTEFIIIFRNGQQKKLQKLKQQFSKVKNVKFIENMPRSKMPQFLSMADIYVSSSVSDGASNNLFEAMACELSTVVTDIPANRHWIRDGENGFLFKPHDYQVLAEKIIFLLQHKEIRSLFGERSRKIIQDKVEQKVQMANIERIYKELL